MAARLSTVKGWVEAGIEKGASHLVVYCDTFDWEDYPVYCDSAAEARRLHAKSGENMQSVEEVYNLNGDVEAQLSTGRRSFEF